MVNLYANTEEQAMTAQTEPPYPRVEQKPKPPEEQAAIAYLAKLRLHRKRYGW